MKNKKIIQYIFRLLMFAVISIVVGLTFYTINARRVTGNRLVMPFNKTIAVVLTGSMEPTIGVNDLIVVEKTNDYKVDDIVVYQDGNLLVVHRIVSIDGETVITSGDANGGALDDPINILQINGEVVNVIPFLGLVLKCIKSPIGICLIISCALLLIVFSYKKEKEEDQRTLDSIKQEIEELKNKNKNINN